MDVSSGSVVAASEAAPLVGDAVLECRGLTKDARLRPTCASGAVLGVGRSDAREALISQEQTIIGPLVEDRTARFVAVGK